MRTNIDNLELDVNKISVKKGDVLVFTLLGEISDKVVNLIRDKLTIQLEHFIKDGVKILVTTDRTKITKITQED